MTSLTQITEARAATEADLVALKKRYEADCDALRRYLALLSDKETQIMAGFDPDRIVAGRAVLAILGKVTAVRHGHHSDQRRHETRSGAVEAAKRDLAEGGRVIRKEYFGVKNYEHFGDQREDHKYGYGPRHGSIVFSVGLQPDVRKRLLDGGELTAEEIEAALYLLNALPDIERQRAKSESAA